MPEETPTTTNPDPTEALRQQLATANARVIQAELRAQATAAGMIDLDCLKFLEPSTLEIDEHGNVPQAKAALAVLKRDKPWVFTRPNSSNPSLPPAPEQPKARMASKMSYEEWQAARAVLIRGK